MKQKGDGNTDEHVQGIYNLKMAAQFHVTKI